MVVLEVSSKQPQPKESTMDFTVANSTYKHMKRGIWPFDEPSKNVLLVLVDNATEVFQLESGFEKQGQEEVLRYLADEECNFEVLGLYAKQ